MKTSNVPIGSVLNLKITHNCHTIAARITKFNLFSSVQMGGNLGCIANLQIKNVGLPPS